MGKKNRSEGRTLTGTQGDRSTHNHQPATAIVAGFWRSIKQKGGMDDLLVRSIVAVVAYLCLIALWGFITNSGLLTI